MSMRHDGFPRGAFQAHEVSISISEAEFQSPKVNFIAVAKTYLQASSIATATATVIPTMGLLPAPISPIISTCAGTEEEPAN